MKLLLDQKGGSLLFRDSTGTRRHVNGGEVIEVGDQVGLRLLAEYPAMQPVLEDEPVVAESIPEPEPEAAPEPEPVVEEPKPKPSGAMSVDDLKSGGRRGRRTRKAT